MAMQPNRPPSQSKPPIPKKTFRMSQPPPPPPAPALPPHLSRTPLPSPPPPLPPHLSRTPLPPPPSPLPPHLSRTPLPPPPPPLSPHLSRTPLPSPPPPLPPHLSRKHLPAPLPPASSAPRHSVPTLSLPSPLEAEGGSDDGTPYFESWESSDPFNPSQKKRQSTKFSFDSSAPAATDKYAQREDFFLGPPSKRPAPGGRNIPTNFSSTTAKQQQQLNQELNDTFRNSRASSQLGTESQSTNPFSKQQQLNQELNARFRNPRASSQLGTESQSTNPFSKQQQLNQELNARFRNPRASSQLGTDSQPTNPFGKHQQQLNQELSDTFRGSRASSQLGIESESTNPFAKPGPPDPYIGSSVVGLTAVTFKPFIQDVDAAFVLFYDPNDDEGTWAKSGVKKAAVITRRPNHAFAAVDCTRESRLCEKQKVESYPTMNLYSKGALVNTFSEAFLGPDQIKSLVERTPVYAHALPTEQKKCAIQ